MDAADAVWPGSDGAPSDTGSGDAGNLFEVRPDGFYRSGSRYFPLVAWALPSGVTDEDAIAAGFDILAGPGDAGLRAIPLLASGDDLAAYVAPYLGDSNLVAWVGPDEALWAGMSVDTLKSEWVDPLRAADPSRPLFLNHAPRGTQAEPTAFDLLAPYVALGDVALMDIYPVPEGNGHSALPGQPGLPAVGAYTGILAKLMSDHGIHEPIMMVLLGSGLGRIPTERWEMLERWVATVDSSHGAFGQMVACDIDGDAVSEVLVHVVSSGGDSILVYDFGESPFGELAAAIPVPTAMGGLAWTKMACGDMQGDGFGDVVVMGDGGPGRQEIWFAAGSAAGLGMPEVVMQAAEQDFDVSVVRHLVLADYNGDGCGDLVVSYDYPDGTQSIFGLASGCGGQGPGPATSLYQGTTATLDLEVWNRAAAADVDEDGRDDIVFGRGDAAVSELAVLRSNGSVLSPPEIAMQEAAGGSDMSHAALVSTNLAGGTARQLAVVGGGAVRAYGPGAGPSASLSSLGTWYSSGGVDAPSVVGVTSGDIDGDGRGDIVVARESPAGVELMLGASTGAYIGARDPAVEEMRFMALNAVLHGSSGLVFWCQQFATVQDTVWPRLAQVAGELRALLPWLTGAGLGVETVGQDAYEWRELSAGSLVLLLQRESRVRGNQAVHVTLPASVAGASLVELWTPSAKAFDKAAQVTLTANELVDTAPLGPYETRLYRVVK